VVEATLFEQDNKVLIEKECGEHGVFEDTYWADYSQYVKAEKYRHDGEGITNPRTEIKRGCPYDCGICPNHKSHTVLSIIDVTNRCNLKCPICFANAATAGYVYEPTREQIQGIMENLRRNSPVPVDALQFSGGEPTIREDLPDLIRMAKELDIRHVEVNTNGIRLAESVEYCRELKRAGASTIYLQFDGITPEPYLTTRGRDLLPIKMKAVENLRAAGWNSVVLVPTLVRGVNDDQVGGIIDFAVKNNDVVRCVNFQPVSITGRIDKAKLKEMRITIPDFMNLCEDQTKGQIKVSDFYPVPSVVPISKAVGALKDRPYPAFTTHPHCGVATFIFVEKGKIVPITRLGNIEKFFAALDKAYESAVKGRKTKARLQMLVATRYLKFKLVRKLVGGLLKEGSYKALGDLARKAILIGAMHFMDPYNFDLERCERCVIHYGVPDGRIIPFCTMNTLHRESIERKFSVPVESWRKQRAVQEATVA
jgi:uncharacterized radical SAM superfamily Fe-S cluster-containing enzyme